MGQLAEKVVEYFRRQYETLEGTVEENVETLFEEDFVYHLSDGKTVGREAIITTAHRIRQAGGFCAASNIIEIGSEVHLRMHARLPDANTGELHSEHTDHVLHFNSEGKITENHPRQPGVVERAFTAGGIETAEPTG